MNLATNLERSALFFPDRPAVSEAGIEMTYGQLNDRSNRIATGLIKMGVRAGDRIGLCAPNSADWIAFYFGVLKAGAVAITLSSLLRQDELTLLLNHSKPRFIFTADDKLDDLSSLRGSAGIEKTICPEGDLTLQQVLNMGMGSFKAVDRERTDTAAVLYTGGTTGMPKGVMLSHENINAGSHNVAFYERSSELDRGLCFLPFNHVFGQIHIMNATILSSGCVELLPKYRLGQSSRGHKRRPSNEILRGAYDLYPSAHDRPTQGETREHPVLLFRGGQHARGDSQAMERANRFDYP